MFYNVILLFKSVQRTRGCLKIAKFERAYIMDGPKEKDKINHQFDVWHVANNVLKKTFKAVQTKVLSGTKAMNKSHY